MFRIVIFLFYPLVEHYKKTEMENILLFWMPILNLIEHSNDHTSK